MTPKEAVEDILIGAGVNAFNVTYNGSPTLATSSQNPVRHFENTSTTFPMEEGIAMVTNGAPNVGGDPDLQAIGGNPTNGVIIEFDFIPTGNMLSFDYIFSSAEYSSFTCSSYNDAFGFFISGPGISGPYSNNSKNIAIVPGSNNIPVSINTVNAGTNADFSGNCYAADPNWQQNSQYFTTSYNSVYNMSNPPISSSSFNGSTVLLQAETSVICGETYHIKLVISNVSDTGFNSGVFLAAGSMAAEQDYEINVLTASGDNEIVKGCEDASICFKRSDLENQDSIFLTYEGSAVAGIDYEELPDFISFESDEDSVCLDLSSISTNSFDGPKELQVIAELYNPCLGITTDTVVIHILDELVYSAEIIQDTCGTGEGGIIFDIDGPDNADYSYSIDGGENFQSNETFTDLSEGTYEIVIEENHGCIINETEAIESYGTPEVTNVVLKNSTCSGECNGELNLTVSNGTAPYHFDWIDHNGNAINNTTHHVVDLCEGEYSVTITDSYGCSTFFDTILTEPEPINPSFDVEDFCEGVSNHATNIEPANGEFSLVASNDGATINASTGEIINGVGGTTYTVAYTINAGGLCEEKAEREVTVFEAPQPEFTADTVIGCDPFEVVFTQENVISGTENTWSFGDGDTLVSSSGTIVHQYTGEGLFDVSLHIISVNGCAADLTREDYIEVLAQPEANFQAAPPTITSEKTTVTFLNQTTGADAYVWDFGDDSPFSFEEDPTHQYPQDMEDATYNVVLYASNGSLCRDTAKLIITKEEDLIFYIPNSFTPDGDEYNNTFQPVFTSGFDPYNFKMTIYNRWGEVIFETYNADMGWDGFYGSQLAPTGTYVWKIEFGVKTTDDKKMHTGFVSLLR